MINQLISVNKAIRQEREREREEETILIDAILFNRRSTYFFSLLFLLICADNSLGTRPTPNEFIYIYSLYFFSLFFFYLSRCNRKRVSRFPQSFRLILYPSWCIFFFCMCMMTQFFFATLALNIEILYSSPPPCPVEEKAEV